MKPIRLPKSLQPRYETPDPKGVAGTYGDAVVAWASRELGIEYGRWQAYVTRKVLRCDANGDLIHSTALLGTGRQNGKSVIVRGIAGWMLDEGHKLDAFSSWTTMLAAAHDQRQARIVYRAVMRDLLGIERIKERNRGRYPDVRLTEYQGVELDGLLFDTTSNQPGASRGFSVGALFWDELLTQTSFDMFEAIGSTQSAMRNAIRILTSTAGSPESIVLRLFFDKLVREASGDSKPDPSFYGAWWQSQDPDAQLDWRAVLQANPALNDGRLSKRWITSEHGTMPPDSWKRERLNHWVDVSVQGAFNPGVWAACRTPQPLAGVDPPFVLAVDIQPGWDRATIAAAALRPDGRIGCEVYRDLRADEHGPITAESLIAAIESFPDPVSVVVYDSVSGAAAPFDRHGLTTWGVEWRALKPHQTVAACMDATEMILSTRLAVDDPLLDAQIPMTGRRNVGQEGAFRFSRSESPGPIDAVMAMTMAVHTVAGAAPPPSIL